MLEITSNVNWLAVSIGAVLSFLLGWLWYSPKLSGTKWAEGLGVSLSDAAAMPVMAMVSQAIATFLLAWVVGVTAASNALATLLLIFVTIILLMIAGSLFAQKSSYAIATETGFVAAMVTIMVLCHVVL